MAVTWMRVLAVTYLLVATSAKRVHVEESFSDLSVTSHNKTLPTGDKYIFVVKYVMQKVAMVEISHTSVVACSRYDENVVDGIEAFQSWCGGGGWVLGCWKDQTSLGAKLNLKSSSCVEYEFGDDSGIQKKQFGRTQYYEEFTQNDNSSTTIYPVGAVTSDAVEQALTAVQDCSPKIGKGGKSYLRDYNPNTYSFLEHNCHGFSDMMLYHLGLPYWSNTKHLPGSFMPEDKYKNPVLGRIVEKFMKLSSGPLPLLRTSWKCIHQRRQHTGSTG